MFCLQGFSTTICISGVLSGVSIVSCLGYLYRRTSNAKSQRSSGTFSALANATHFPQTDPFQLRGTQNVAYALYAFAADVAMLPYIWWINYQDLPGENRPPTPTAKRMRGEIKEVITIAAPLSGTITILHPLGSKCVEQVQEGSPFLESLNHRVKKIDTRFHHLGSLSDVIILPSKSAFADNGRENHLNHPPLVGIGHSGLLWSEELVNALVPILGEDKDKPILMIHGILSSRSCWWFVYQRLTELGYTNLFTINLGSTFESIDEHYCPKVLEMVDEVATTCQRSDVTIMGHSLGGIVATHAAIEHQSKNKPSILRVIR